jgi:hypothetical protein
METPTTPENHAATIPTPFGQRAANGSLICGVSIFVLLLVGGSTGAKVVIELVALVLIVAGLILGAIGLFAIRRHGVKGILLPALVGIVINGLLAFIFVTNFSTARARARSPGNLPPTVPVLAGKTPLRSYNNESIGFDYDGAYRLKLDKKNGLIVLQHADSSVLVGNFGQVVDVAATLKIKASEIQQGLRNQSNSRFTQSGIETVNGSMLTGSLLRTEYDKVAEGRIHMDLYLLSGPTNSIFVSHFYTERKKANAQSLFTTILQSLKDGS